jgi:transcription elongation factor Elf1
MLKRLINRIYKWIVLQLHDHLIDLIHAEILRLDAPKERWASCPACGQSYELTSLGLAHHSKSAVIICSKCKRHIEIRPGLLWERVEVELR